MLTWRSLGGLLEIFEGLKDLVMVQVRSVDMHHVSHSNQTHLRSVSMSFRNLHCRLIKELTRPI